MTEIGIQIGCLALRVTVLAAIAAAAASWSARRSARSAVVVLAGAVAILLVLSAASFCPTPDIGWGLGPNQAGADSGLKAAPPGPIEAAPGSGLDVRQAWRLLQKFASKAIAPSLWRDGSTIVAGLYGLGVALASLRLLMGWLSIQALRRGSRPITDPSMLQRLCSLRANLGCARSVELCECGEPGLAATVGWRRPVILLPPEWRDWTTAECQAVLAHELAHIRHKDYLIGLATRLCQVVHFYNPMVHWLSAQVRWQQELAADELATHTEVERGQYVKALASMALRSPARMPAGALPWSAMTGGAFLRRIQMLRYSEKSRPLSRAVRGFLIGALAAAGLLLSTLGSPATPPELVEPFEVGYLPAQASAFVALRPAVMMRQPGMDKLKQVFAAALSEAKKLGFTVPDALNPENIEEIVANLDFRRQGPGTSGKAGVLILGCDSLFVRLKSDFDWPGFFKNLTREFNAFAKSDIAEPVEMSEAGVTIHRLGVVPMLGPTPLYFHMPDSRTVVFSGNAGKTNDEVASFRQVLANVASARQRDWGVGYKKVARAAIAVVAGRAEAKRGDDISAPLSVLLDEQPIDEDSRALLRRHSENLKCVTLGMEVGEGKPVRVVLEAMSADAAPELAKAIERAVGSMIEEIQQGNMDAQTRFITELWQSRKLIRDGASLEWITHFSGRLADLLD